MMIHTTQLVKEQFDVNLLVVQLLEQPDPQSNPPDPGGETPKIAPDRQSNPPDPGPQDPKVSPDRQSNPPDPGPETPKIAD